jgi:heat-inducible transcriptional repressor
MIARLLTPRQHQLVTKVIEEYIRTAEPVSSKAIAASGHFDVQSATIRNEMSDLEEAGYLVQLHTSGGRVPTAQAYRLYVDEMIDREGVSISHASRRRVEEALSDADMRDPEQINKVLARVVGQLSGTLVMASISERPDAYKVGLSNLLSSPEFRQMDRLMDMTEFFDQFDLMCDQLHRRMWGPAFARTATGRPRDAQVRVMIGNENSDERVQDETLIVAKYALPGSHDGSLTLIGPMRMDYRKNIGLMMYAAQIAERIAKA